jgi:hypothetical protein
MTAQSTDFLAGKIFYLEDENGAYVTVDDYKNTIVLNPDPNTASKWYAVREKNHYVLYDTTHESPLGIGFYPTKLIRWRVAKFYLDENKEYIYPTTSYEYLIPDWVVIHYDVKLKVKIISENNKK